MNNNDNKTYRLNILDFELYVMDLTEKCQTTEDFELLAEQLHESVEMAIQEMCMDAGIEDYAPSY